MLALLVFHDTCSWIFHEVKSVWLHFPSYGMTRLASHLHLMPSLIEMQNLHRGHQPLSCSHPAMGTLILCNMRGTLHTRLRNSAVARQRGNHSNSKLAHHLVDTLMSLWRPLLLTMSICLPWETKKKKKKKSSIWYFQVFADIAVLLVKADLPESFKSFGHFSQVNKKTKTNKNKHLHTRNKIIPSRVWTQFSICTFTVEK